jgi:hypothetical protein
VSEYRYATVDLAERLDIAPKTVRKKAAKLGLGIDLGGRAGFRYSEDDYRRLVESMRPAAAEPRRRRRRAAVTQA